MKKIKTVLSVTAVLLAALLIFAFLNILLSPKYMTENIEGAMLSQYYREYGGHDVIFVGDCEVYANFSPLEMWRSHGITAYVRGSSQQLIWQSYGVLAETLKYETPKAIVYNVNAMRYDKSATVIKEEYNRLTLDKMRWSREKIDMIRASMTEDEDFWSYVFPILRYHDRFDKLTQEDFTYLFQTKDVTFNGFLLNQRVVPMGKLPTRRPLTRDDFSDICYDYLDKMTALCAENGVELILIKAPSQYPYWYDEQDAQIAQYAADNGLAYYDFTKKVDEIGLDFLVDTYDAGLHLNYTGAVKMSNYFAQILAEHHGITDHRSDAQIAAVYTEKLKIYDEAIQKGKEQLP